MAKKPRPSKKQHARHKKEDIALKQNLTPTEGDDNDTGEGVPALPLPPTIPSAQGIPIGKVVGLTNLGNTCYFNSLTQVLLSSSLVVDEFLPDRRRGNLGQGLHEVAKASYGTQTDADSVDTTTRITRGQKRSKPGVFTPQRLHSSILKIAPQFKGGREQDSHEYMRLLLDGLNNEETKLNKQAGAKQVPDSSEAQAEAQEESFVRRIFGGMFASDLHCSSCNNRTTSAEEFLDISVPLPRERPTNNTRSQGGSERKASLKGKKAPISVPASTDDSLSTKQQKKKAKQDIQRQKADRKRERQKERSKSLAAELVRESQEEAIQSCSDQNDAEHSSPQVSSNPRLSKKTRTVDSTATAEYNLQAESSDKNLGDSERILSTADRAEGPGEPGAKDLDSQGESFNMEAKSSAGEGVSQDVTQNTNGNSDEPNLLPDTQIGARQASESTQTDEQTKQEKGSDWKSDVHASNQGLDHVAQNGQTPAEAHFIPDRHESTVEEVQVNSPAVASVPNGMQSTAMPDNLKDRINAEYAAAWESDGETPTEHGKSDLQKEATSERHPHSLESCLAAFFAPETVDWFCPSERKQLNPSASSSEDEFQTPMTHKGRIMHRVVSFSEEKPRVKLIPGSSEQRGTDMREALRGQVPFCRPLKVREASLVVTAEAVPSHPRRRLGLISVGVQPLDEEPATMDLLPDAMHIIDVDTQPVEDSEDEDEQQWVASRAQLLMDCVSDMITHEGIEGMQRMVECGVDLHPFHKPLTVRGQLPADTGGGTWEYPLKNVASPEMSALQSRDSYLSCSSPVSDSMMESGIDQLRAKSAFADRSNAIEEPEQKNADKQDMSEIQPGLSLTSFESIQLEDSPMKRHVPSEASPSFFTARDSMALPPASHDDSEATSGGGSAISQQENGPAPVSGVEETSTHPLELGLTGVQAVNSKQRAGVQANTHLPDSSVSKTESQAQFSGHEFKSPEGSEGRTEDIDSEGTGSRQSQASLDGSTVGSGKTSLLPASKASASKNDIAPKLQKAKKAYAISRLPKVLAIQLKRFEILSNGKTKKLRDIISFPPELDMEPFCHPQAEAQQREKSKYDLVGVVVHEGPSLQSGHYWAYVRRWVRSDEVTGETAKDDSSSSEILSTQSGNKQAASPQDREPSLSRNEGVLDENEGVLDEEDRDTEAGGSTVKEPSLRHADGSQKTESTGTISKSFEVLTLTEQLACSSTRAEDCVWYRANDTQVSKARSLQDVLSCEAYILLYQQKA